MSDSPQQDERASTFRSVVFCVFNVFSGFSTAEFRLKDCGRLEWNVGSASIA